MLAGQYNDSQLRIKGLQAYTKAVQEMAAAVQSPKRSSSDGALAAVSLLEFYEVRICRELAHAYIC